MEEVKVTKAVAKQEAAQTSVANDVLAPILPFGRWVGTNSFGLMHELFTRMHELTDELDRAFRGVAVKLDGATELMAWSPALDVRQCNGDLVVTAEVPGLKKDEVKVELTDRNLVIQGERQREHKDDHEGYHRWERSYGKFRRSIELPEGAQTDQVKAELHDGVLRVSVPVPHAAKQARQVPIETRTASKN